MGPFAGVEGSSAEILHPVELGVVRLRQTSDRHHAVARVDRATRVGGEVPDIGYFVPAGLEHTGIETDVRAEFEPIGNVIDIGENLRLGCVTLGPLP